MSNFHQLESVPVHQRGGAAIQVVAGKSLMVFWIDVKAGTHVAAPQHVNEQTTWLIAGRTEYRISNGEPTMCVPGTIVHIPANVKHEVW